MHVRMENWKNGWCGVSIGIELGEIERLIQSLNMLRQDPGQHFHISSDYKGNGGVGDIEIYVSAGNEDHNISLSSRALAPGEDLTD